jgi:hypothetical protein
MLRYIPAYTYTSSLFMHWYVCSPMGGSRSSGMGGGGLSPLPFYMNAYNLNAIIYLINWGKRYFIAFELRKDYI